MKLMSFHVVPSPKHCSFGVLVFDYWKLGILVDSPWGLLPLILWYDKPMRARRGFLWMPGRYCTKIAWEKPAQVFSRVHWMWTSLKKSSIPWTAVHETFLRKSAFLAERKREPSIRKSTNLSHDDLEDCCRSRGISRTRISAKTCLFENCPDVREKMRKCHKFRKSKICIPLSVPIFAYFSPVPM